MKYEDVQKELETALQFLESEQEDVLLQAEEGLKITKRALVKVRNQVTKTKFKSKDEEIYFFKYTKPQIYSRLIYYWKLFNIESKKPRSSKKTIVKYLYEQIDKLQIYFNDNLEFYHYYRRGSTFLDESYFLRGKTDIRLHPDSVHFFIDEQFSTSHDSTVATILAYDMLIVQLKQEIDKIQNKGMETGTLHEQSKLFWTANKIDLIELIYAIHSTGAINSGTADIKEMASVCEKIFNIELGDYYRTFLEIRMRKINQTKFLDKLKESLLQRMADLDQ